VKVRSGDGQGAATFLSPTTHCAGGAHALVRPDLPRSLLKNLSLPISAPSSSSSLERRKEMEMKKEKKNWLPRFSTAS
jgi:hypothetical protein